MKFPNKKQFSLVKMNLFIFKYDRSLQASVSQVSLQELKQLNELRDKSSITVRKIPMTSSAEAVVSEYKYEIY